jgi:hypothetical protein
VNALGRIARCLRDLRDYASIHEFIGTQRKRLDVTLDELKLSVERERDAMNRVAKAREKATAHAQEVTEVVEDIVRRMNE